MRVDFFQTGMNHSLGQKPVLVFLHGLFGGLGNFDTVIKKLQTEYAIVVPSLPLFHNSEVKPLLSELLIWLDSFLNQFEAQKFCLVGNSLGGQLACIYAGLRPEKVHSLVLTGAAGMGELAIGYSKPKRFDRSYIKEKAALTFFNHTPEDRLIDEIASIINSPTELRRLLSWSRDSLRTKLDRILPQIEAPALLIWGRNDCITPVECAFAFQKHLPRATCSLIENCGHAPMMENPDSFAQLLLSFLRQQIETTEIIFS